MKEVPWLGTVIVGNSKQPISLESLNSSNYISFMERSLPRMFLVDERRVGMHAANRIPSEALIWDYGVFMAAPVEEDHEVVSDNPGVRVVGRAVTTPVFLRGRAAFPAPGHGRRLANRGRGQPVAVAIATGSARRSVLHRLRVFDSRSLYTLDFESAVNWGAFSLQSELYYNRNDSMFGDIDLYGAYAEASWFLTGESRPYDRSRGILDRLKPYTNFWLVRGRDGVDIGWGAWQLAARWSAIDLSDCCISGGESRDATRYDRGHQLVLEPEHSLDGELDPRLECIRPGRGRIHRWPGGHSRRAWPTGFLNYAISGSQA